MRPVVGKHLIYNYQYSIKQAIHIPLRKSLVCHENYFLNIFYLCTYTKLFLNISCVFQSLSKLSQSWKVPTSSPPKNPNESPLLSYELDAIFHQGHLTALSDPGSHLQLNFVCRYNFLTSLSLLMSCLPPFKPWWAAWALLLILFYSG